MEGEGRKKANFWAKLDSLVPNHTQRYAIDIDGEYQGLRLPVSTQVRAMRTFLVLFLVIFTSLFIIIGCQPTATDAVNYPELQISSIDLESPVEPIEPVDRQLEAPATIAGAYSQHNNKTLIIGHSTTVFQNLHNVKIGEEITYGNRIYKVIDTETLLKQDVNMKEVLQGTDRETIIIMTCAGELLKNQDATHRFLVTAVLI